MSNVIGPRTAKVQALATSRTPVRALVLGASVVALAAALYAFPVKSEQRVSDPNIVRAQFAPGIAPNFVDLVDKVKPAVVSISVSSGTPRVARNNGERRPPQRGQGARPFPELPEDHPLNELFRNLPPEFRGAPGQQPERRGPRNRQAVGSGFVISPDGFVVTNNHVIDGADKIEVSFDEKKKYEAQLVGTDPRTDIALLKIKDGGTFPAVKFADRSPRVGEWVLAVGNPFGLGGTVTAGIVSALARDIGSGPYDFLQIDAAVNRGNSGGPTFNLQGEVVGVNTAIYSPSGGNVGIAFAVPASTAKEVVEQIKSSGSVQRGWLGVRIQNVDADIAASLGLASAKGALVNEVTAEGPAAAAGLRSQDAIVAIDGKPIEDSRDLARRVAEYSPNTTVDVQVRRAGRDETVKVKLGVFPGSTQVAAKPEADKPTPGAGELGDLGIQITPLPAGGLPGAASVKQGVVIADVKDDSDAATKGLKTGDVITEVNGEKVTSPADLRAAVTKARDAKRPAVLLTVQTGDNRRVVAVQLRKVG